MVTELIKYGYIKEAREALLPMLERVVKYNDVHEWYTLENEAKGSGSYRGTAGVLWETICALEEFKNNF